MFFEKALGYDDITLIPRYFSGSSRSSIDTAVEISSRKFELPIIPANMKCVINEEIAKLLDSHNYFYVMHRFGIDNYKFVLNANKENWNIVSISVGVKKEDQETLARICEDGLKVDFITVDIAHGHSLLMKEMLTFLNKKFPDATIIAGNVGSPEGAQDLVEWGADILKVGVGPGKSCITKLKTGFYTPMFSTIKIIKEVLRRNQPNNIKIIADGGIHHNGDITKALVAGADLVMAGSIFANCSDSPASVVGGKKVFYGSASAHNKETIKNIEGKRVLLDCLDITLLQKFQEIKEDLQSSVSYAGGSCLEDLKDVMCVPI